MNKKVLVWGLVGVLLVAGLVFPRGNSVVQQIVGAAPTLDGVDFPFMSINGQREWRGTVAMMATSSVVCSVKNPFAATSSIEYISAEATARGGVAAANNFVISTSTSQYATSTLDLVHDYAMGTGQFSVVMAKNTSTTTASATHITGAPAGVVWGMDTAGRSLYVLGPSQYINFLISTSSPGGGGTFSSYMTGKCSVVLKKI